MIVTVTMNPAIDKTVEITSLVRGGLNRIKHVELDAGGKGINVSKTVCELGGKTIATGFLGGNSGKVIESVLSEREITCDFVWVAGETRTNTKVFEENGDVTELNEPGVVPSEAQLEELMQKLDGYAGEETLFVLAGSVPGSVDKGIYGEIIKRVHAKGAKVLLDADGELFKKALSAGPDIIKPNRVELEEYAGYTESASEEELLVIARRFIAEGIGNVVISMGKEGAMFVKADRAIKCPALKVKAHSTVGAGDAMVAALAYSWDNQLEDAATMKLCIATSAGAVTTVGTKPPTRELVDELQQNVEVVVL